jgi:hypothetical protein
LFVGGTGRSKWIVGKRDLLMRRKGDPPVVVDKQGAFDTLMEQDPVNTVVFEGRPPTRSHAVWDSVSVRAVLWIANRRMRGGAKPPTGWRWKRMDTRHDECGGVSNGVFVSYLATRSDESEREWSTKIPAVKNNLRQAIDPTLGGRKAAIDF